MGPRDQVIHVSRRRTVAADRVTVTSDEKEFFLADWNVANGAARFVDGKIHTVRNIAGDGKSGGIRSLGFEAGKETTAVEYRCASGNHDGLGCDDATVGMTRPVVPVTPHSANPGVFVHLSAVMYKFFDEGVQCTYRVELRLVL